MAQADPTTLFPLPWGVWLTVLLAVLPTVVLQRTVFGTRVFALGSNEATARLCGIHGSMIGALIMAVLRNGSNQIGWPTYVQEILIGIVIVVAVGLDKLRRWRSRL